MSSRRSSPSHSASPSVAVVPAGSKLKAKTLIAGFHGIGATGYWSVKFLIDEVKAKRAFYIDSEFAPAVSSTLNKSISTPYEVFAAGKIAFLKADVPPLRENETRFFRELGDWILDSGVDEVALIGGLDESLRTDDSKYRVVLTDAMKKKGEMKGEPILEDGKMIVGPVALLLNRLQMHDFPAYAILAYSSTERVDPRAAASAAEFVAKRYKLKIVTAPLIQGAEELEKEMMGLAQKDKERGPPSAIYS
ncbi:MAG: PAC2 family protein [Thaumarchaeota archaeon]|nr:PAC2 family protein [Nitrososphaerota archaeon]